MRKTPQEIREGIRNGFQDSYDWSDLIYDFILVSDREEDRRLMVQCADFLERQFPGEKFGWQDFDILLSDKLQGRYTRRDYGGLVLDEDVRDGVVAKEAAMRMTDAEVSAYPLTKEGFHLMDATDDKGGVIAFTGIRTIADVRRN